MQPLSPITTIQFRFRTASPFSIISLRHDITQHPNNHDAMYYTQGNLQEKVVQQQVYHSWVHTSRILWISQFILCEMFVFKSVVNTKSAYTFIFCIYFAEIKFSSKNNNEILYNIYICYSCVSKLYICKGFLCTVYYFCKLFWMLIAHR